MKFTKQELFVLKSAFYNDFAIGNESGDYESLERRGFIAIYDGVYWLADIGFDVIENINKYEIVDRG